MNKLIAITGETMEWSEGNHGALDIKVRRGCSVTVKCDRSRDVVLKAQSDYDTWCRAEFNFCKKGIVIPYKIEIYSENTDSILGMIDVLWDTKVESVLIHECPSLVSLRFHNVNYFDFNGCPNLEHLDCDNYKGAILDLTSLPKLKNLLCRSGVPTIIEMPKSLRVVSLDLCGCKMKKLRVGNQTQFKNLNIDYCDNLKGKTGLWLKDRLMKSDG